MHHINHIAAILLLCGVLAGCAGKTTVRTFDFSERRGLYVLAYIPSSQIRIAMENQLVADLEARDMIAFASHEDLPDLQTVNRRSVIAAANEQQAIAVLLVNQVTPDGARPDTGQERISPEHPDVQSFFEYTKSLEEQPQEERTVLAEVTGFLLQGESAQQFWSGTTWSFEADGQGGAIRGISGTIADEFARMRDAMKPR